MKWPVPFWLDALREMWCRVAGHDWKHCARVRVRDTEPAGWTRRSLGNPYFEDAASWQAKCRRCRARTRDWPWYPLWREIGWALRNFGSAFWIGITCYTHKRVEGRAYAEVTWRGRLLILPMAIAFGLEQGYGQLCGARGFFGWPLSLLGALHCWFGDRVEREATWYRWLPPDGPPYPGHREIGLWVRSDLVQEPRTRCYVCEPSATSTTTGCGVVTTLTWGQSL